MRFQYFTDIELEELSLALLVSMNKGQYADMYTLQNLADEVREEIDSRKN